MRHTPGPARPAESVLGNWHRRLAAAGGDAAVLEDLAALIQSDGKGALSLAAKIARNPEERYRFINHLLPLWASADAPAAWRWACERGADCGESGHAALTELVLERVARERPGVVVELLAADRWANPHAVHESVVALLRVGAAGEAQTLIGRWCEGASPPSDMVAPFERIAMEMARESPAKSIAWLLTLPSSSGREAGLAAAIDTWAIADAPSAMAWANGVLPTGAGDRACERAFGRWVERDAAAALGWLAEHEADARADRWIGRWLAVSTEVTRDFAVARPWLELIRDPALRAQAAELMNH